MVPGPSSLTTEQPEVHFPAPSSGIPCYFQLAMKNSWTRTATYPYWGGPGALQTGSLPVSFLQLSNCIKYTPFLFGPLLNSFYSNDCTLAPVKQNHTPFHFYVLPLLSLHFPSKCPWGRFQATSHLDCPHSAVKADKNALALSNILSTVLPTAVSLMLSCAVCAPLS